MIADSRSVALGGFQPKLSQGERKLKAELAAAIHAGGISPPDANDLAAAAGPRGTAVTDLLALLRDEGHIVEINSQLYLDIEIESELRRRVTERLADGSSSRWPNSATCWARPANTPCLSASTSTASA